MLLLERVEKVPEFQKRSSDRSRAEIMDEVSSRMFVFPRGLRSHTPTSGNMERQSSSHGDFMTLANPIYDVYNAASTGADSCQTPVQRIVSPTAALRRSESAR